MGLVKELEGYLFDYDCILATADKMKTTQEKIAKYVSLQYSDDVQYELIHRTRVVLTQLDYPAAAVARQEADQKEAERQHATNLASKEKILSIVKEQELKADPYNLQLMIQEAVVENEISQLKYLMKREVPIEMTKAEETVYNNRCRAPCIH